MAALLLRRDHGPDAMPAQPVADALGTVGPIGGQAFGPTAGPPLALPDAHTVQDVLELGRLVRLARQQQGGQRHAVPIAEHVHFGAEAAP
jgi:hypothetical protein